MINALERARRYVAKCPVAVSGQSGHDATFHVAAVLVHGFALCEQDALGLLREWNGGCVPPWSESELVHKIKSAAGAKHAQPRGHLLKGDAVPPPVASRLVAVPVQKPEFKPGTLKRIAERTAGIVDVVVFVAERSPVRVDTQDSASVLRRLYRYGSGEKVLIFSKMESQGQFIWEANRSDFIQDRDLPKGPDGIWMLAQPVDGKFHPNPRLNGKLSRRSEESVTEWRYVLLESDEADADLWLRCLMQMPLRIACVCESGSRSIHALVRVDASNKADWDGKVGAIKPILITLGADPKALSAVRLTRLPQAQRGQRKQRLLYLNAAPDGTPILNQPVPDPLYARRGAEMESGDE